MRLKWEDSQHISLDSQVLAKYHYLEMAKLFYLLLETFHRMYHQPQGREYIRELRIKQLSLFLTKSGSQISDPLSHDQDAATSPFFFLLLVSTARTKGPKIVRMVGYIRFDLSSAPCDIFTVLLLHIHKE